MNRNDASTTRFAARWDAFRHVAMNVLADFARAAV
ncbi:hypothetical protein AWB83_03357 [Caballeronia ptereochthonis]|uniref:Uncharacterized protein n=1 Tax=Caballeronia ptereochthonis TaxID=1777144 RepID=A0A158BM69_9BURK|nr:hypothetical protein AWB83_03357 [Caballeronia ptereochthonis]